MHPDNWPTVYGAVSGILLYLNSVGFAIPSTKQEWCALLGGIAMAALGLKSAGVR